MSSSLWAAVGDVDHYIVKARTLMIQVSKHDPELAAGGAVDDMDLVDKKLNQAIAAAEDVDLYLRGLTK